MIHDYSADAEVPAEGGSLVYPMAFEGMTGGFTFTGDDVMVSVAEGQSELGSGEDEPIDGFGVVDTITDIERYLERFAVDGFAIAVVFGCCSAEVKEYCGLEAQTCLRYIIYSCGTNKETWTYLIDVFFVVIVAYSQFAYVQSACHSKLELGKGVLREQHGYKEDEYGMNFHYLNTNCTNDTNIFLDCFTLLVPENIEKHENH